MRTTLKFIPILLIVFSCKNIENQHLEKENELLKKELELQKREDSINRLIQNNNSDKNSSEKTKLENKKTGSEVISDSKYSYIKQFKNKYASEVELFESGVLKTQIIKLIGLEKYNVFLKNMSVKGPIKVINDEYVFLKGGAPHSFGSDEACIEIDFVSDKISIGIMEDGERVFFYTEKENKNYKQTKGELNEWLSNANQNIKK